MRKNNKYYIRKAHRYLGIIIGVQFLLWTLSGLYFSWTNIDDIHGDHFFKEKIETPSVKGLTDLKNIDPSIDIESLELTFINSEPFYWVNEKLLIDAYSGDEKQPLNKEEAINVAQYNINEDYEIKSAELLTTLNKHHEYREGPLPAWAITFEGNENLIAYVSANDGSFQRVRYSKWRWFDFLWMTHTMDYNGRDNFNNLLLRIFSLFGLITVCSGFLLFFVTHKWK